MDYPVTPAVRALREKGIAFEPHLYAYEERGGTRHSAESLDVDEHAIVKPLIVLMHGDREVSTKQLAREIGAKSVVPCKPEVAQKHTGYLVGGTSPLATRAAMPIYVERTIFDEPRIYLNGGKRGFLVSIDPQVLRELLPVEEVEVAIA
jgi:Cys-tRNA(Pro) deacylase